MQGGHWNAYGCDMLITVYMPTKNRADMMQAAIESVLRQSYTNFELIVVNDGSEDHTASVLANACARDPRIRVITNPTSVGGAAARNLAIQDARGEFVTGLDDDDEFMPDRLGTFVEAWKAYTSVPGDPPSCLYSQLNVVEFGKITHRTQKPRTATFEEMFAGNVVGNQIFAPREHFIGAGLFNPALPAWQDLEFFMRVLKKFGPGRLVDSATYNFENSPRQDRISQKSEAKMRTAFEIVRDAHAGGNRRLTQQLYLQLFARLYGIRPTARDYLDFLRLGVWLPGLIRMTRASVG